MKEDIFYCPISGNLRSVATGKIIGSKNHQGYITFAYKKKKYMAHRYAWFYMTGAWPVLYIDHIDGNPSNNKFENLREANFSENSCNRKAGSNNKLGVKGVWFDVGMSKWRSDIKKEGKRYFLGYFDSVEEATKAYNDASIKLHKEFAYTLKEREGVQMTEIDDCERFLRPVSGKTCQYTYLDFNLRGVPEIRTITMPQISVLGPGPFMIKRRD